jgi:hypothetical protein
VFVGWGWDDIDMSNSYQDVHTNLDDIVNDWGEDNPEPKLTTKYKYDGSFINLMPPPFSEDCVFIVGPGHDEKRRAQHEQNGIPTVDMCDGYRLHL